MTDVYKDEKKHPDYRKDSQLEDEAHANMNQLLIDIWGPRD